MAIGRGALALGLLLAVSQGCATPPADERVFVGGQVGGTDPVPQQPAALPGSPAGGLVAHATVEPGEGRRPRLALRLSNHGTGALPLSAVLDTYEATLRSGQSVPLEEDFLTYPSQLDPQREVRISLLPSESARVEEIIRLSASLNGGQVRLVLEPRSLGLTAPRPSRTRRFWRRSSTSRAIQPAASVEMPPIYVESDGAPGATSPPVWERAVEPGVSAPAAADGPVAPEAAPRVVVAAPEAQEPALPQQAAAPVDIEFEQELGSTLRLELRWNHGPQALTLSPGERAAFALQPGPHTLRLASRLPPSSETHGSLPVVAEAGVPLRVLVSGTPRFTGVQLRARVWQGERVVSDQTFTPLSTRPTDKPMKR